MIWERTRHVLRLRSALREYFPAALNAFGDLDEPLRAESRRLADLRDPVTVITAVGDTFAALDAELERIARVRLAAVRRLRNDG